MIRVGLTGGIASGKSQVSQVLRDLGAYIIDADEIAHEVILPGTPAYGEILDHFGPQVRKEDGSIDRSKLGRQVFQDPQRRAVLEGIIHPRVFAVEEARREQIARKDPQAVVVFDAPLLIEARAHERMDKVIVVYADEMTQLKRLIERDGLEPEEAQRRISSQSPFSEKKRYADYIIDGTVSLQEMAKQTETIFREMVALAARSRQG